MKKLKGAKPSIAMQSKLKPKPRTSLPTMKPVMSLAQQAMQKKRPVVSSRALRNRPSLNPMGITKRKAR